MIIDHRTTSHPIIASTLNSTESQSGHQTIQRYLINKKNNNSIYTNVVGSLESISATTFSGWVLAVAKALESYGIDPSSICESVDIDLDKASDPNVRFETVKTSQLFRIAAEVSEDPCFGLTVGRMMRPTSWHALGFSLWASQDLFSVLQRIGRFTRIFTNSAYIELDTHSNHIRFLGRSYPKYRPILSNFQYEAFLATVVLICRYIYPQTFYPLAIGLPRQHSLDDMGCFERMFNCPIFLGQDGVWMDIDLKTARHRLPTANSELALHNDQLCMEYMSRFDFNDIQERIYKNLMDSLHQSEPSIEEMASRLNLSSRTMQRKLKEQGTSYKHLLDEAKRSIAIQFLQQPHISIGEVSYLLGFTHVSNFSRAFKRRTGFPPHEWRTEIKKEASIGSPKNLYSRRER